MSRTGLAAVLLATIAATPAVAPASANAAKPAAKKCKKGTVLVKTGRKKRCIKLRVAPPTPKQADRGQLALDFLLSSKWPALRDRRGRRVPSLTRRLRDAGRGAAPALRRTFARGLALVAARRRSAPAATGAVRGQPRGWPRARAADDGVTGVSDGSTIGFNGEIPAGDITIFVQFRTGLDSDRIEGEDCPTGAGRLEGRKRGETSISIRLVGPNRRLISGYSATFGEENTYQGQTADDAKIDTLTIDHDGIARTTITGAGQAPLSLRMVTRRRAQVNMRSRTYTAGERQLDIEVRLTGAPAEIAALLEAEVARKLQGETDREFAEVVYTAMFGYRQMEARFNQDFNRCVSMRYDPRPDQRRYFVGERGRFSAWVEPTLDRGTRPNGIFKRANQLNVEGTPAEASGTTAELGFVVTTASNPSWVQYRATSKAGVAFGTHDVLTESIPLYKVVGMAYTDHMSANNIFTYVGCTYSSSQNNTATFLDSGAPSDGAVGPHLDGTLGGSLIAQGNIGKYAEFQGCKWNDTASARVSCTLTGTGTEPFFIPIEIGVPAGDGPARVTWHPRGPSIGDVPPTISECEPFPLQGPFPGPVTTDVARSLFFDPGTHTIALDVPATVPAVGGIGTIISTAHYAVTFKRVNEDGSPYTG
jgi:hypothetical protein